MTRKEFDTRYHIRTNPSGVGFYVMDIAKRKVEAGPGETMPFLHASTLSGR